jgi:ATP-dependent Clp endopeptidase proteolytic subunit ClpP
MIRIPRDAKKRKSLLTYWELRKAVADALRSEAEFATHEASASRARVYTFYGEIGEESIRECLSEIGVWSREYPGQSLSFVFNSPGGTLVDGRALYDYILHLRSQGHHITTICLGEASSMGSILLQAGDVRVMGPNSWLMIHEGADDLSGTRTSLRAQLKQLDREDDQLTHILAERSKLTFDEINERMKNKDWFMNAQEAVDNGFADEILSPKHMKVPRKDKRPKLAVEDEE